MRVYREKYQFIVDDGFKILYDCALVSVQVFSEWKCLAIEDRERSGLLEIQCVIGVKIAL